MDVYDVVARYYDNEHSHIRQDVDMYIQFARSFGESILVCGVGTGRVGLGLAQHGFETWGFDNSPSMLARARESAVATPNLHLFEADMTSLELGHDYSLVVIPLDCLTGLGTLEAQRAALLSAQRHLEGDGMLIVDVVNPFRLPVSDENGLVRTRFRDESQGRKLIITESTQCDEAAQRLELLLRYDVLSHQTVATETATLIVRWLYRYELELLAEVCGLQTEHIYGDYDLAEYVTSSPRLILTATPNR